ncbi:hypothetical protein C0039_14960 [Pseudohalioglobus lutimaris]|uniref:Uncharacterized protein n=1 Tax=Pseudohalioglobus lutimaris TaxID=1737061 RepID=A0A2N5X0C3_9GAMM|nr:hypothetical protein C0039_14960 [Pseudohalioglobus lutimaris]
MVIHPKSGPGEWNLQHLVYAGGYGETAVALLSDGKRTAMALRWCEGNENVKPWQGEETGWFLIPYSFAAAIAKSLVQMKAAGGVPFDEDGFTAMLDWLIEDEGIESALCY